MRKSKPKKRIILPDPKFNDVLVTKFVNNLMYTGKKNLAFQIFYEAIETVTEKTSEDGLEVWKKALSNVTPNVEVRSRRIGGATFQIPSEIRPGRKSSIGMKNLILFARKRHEKTMSAKLAGEIMAAYKEEGAAFKRKEDTHRMADANKAFSHFRF
ncbi:MULTISPECIES: 30S ribosomal protein S7 [Lentimicrobium]|jgi:small subunit ribosomal protein S7|uniref:Small ribosomal subunit protein uS7 n=2 Tax=root TaxID=1 RepID=A0A0S7C0P9_9BACT|nr:MULTISPECIES: 30S ribosomal protein S7 [Lentimicrobium]MCO5256012.1 30S ribosomal protein S7 [Lentimicrobium sp.]MCO5262787.1 30S ribosomal protein S7 [Lentimicrobium sp.]MEA5111094.1 30S ribosomal protein S7 [Lentimicrobium sp.]GAP43268.1 ribosomal protein S7 [Lentimicrobium saccharophilum]HPF64698.1 30S ribosomal protein S7 [Lentimicrobium sp.]